VCSVLTAIRRWRFSSSSCCQRLFLSTEGPPPLLIGTSVGNRTAIQPLPETLKQLALRALSEAYPIRAIRI
jgi:hypothetical protein